MAGIIQSIKDTLTGENTTSPTTSTTAGYVTLSIPTTTVIFPLDPAKISPQTP